MGFGIFFAIGAGFLLALISSRGPLKVEGRGASIEIAVNFVIGFVVWAIADLAFITLLAAMIALSAIGTMVSGFLEKLYNVGRNMSVNERLLVSLMGLLSGNLFCAVVTTI